MSAVMEERVRQSAPGKPLKEKRRAAIAAERRERTIMRRIESMRKHYEGYHEGLVAAICGLIAGGLTATAACDKAKVSRDTFFGWVARHPEAAKMYELAQKARVESRAEQAVEGALASEDPALAFKALTWDVGKQKPEKYGEKSEVKHSGTVTLAALVGLAMKLKAEGEVVDTTSKPVTAGKP